MPRIRQVRAYTVGVAVNGVATYGHWGRPVLAFPAERGDAGEFERRGMVAAVGDLLAAGRVKLYCVDSFDGESWSNRSIPLEERARRHQFYESWILGEVVPFIRDDCAGAAEVITCGCSLGAYHAANFALKRADVFPLAICMSGSYDPAAWDGWGERGENAYFNNPMDYVAHLARRPPRLAALAAQPATGVRAGAMGGHHRRAGVHAPVRRAAAVQADPVRDGPLGV